MQHSGRTLFITFVTHARWRLPEAAREIVLGCCLRDRDAKYVLHAAVVMPDHVHLILSPLMDVEGASFAIATIMNGIKGASAHAVNKILGRRGRVWQPESFDHVLRSNESARSKAEYVCANPVRAGLVATEDAYPWLWREWVEGMAAQG